MSLKIFLLLWNVTVTLNINGKKMERCQKVYATNMNVLFTVTINQWNLFVDIYFHFISSKSLIFSWFTYYQILDCFTFPCFFEFHEFSSIKLCKLVVNVLVMILKHLLINNIMQWVKLSCSIKLYRISNQQLQSVYFTLTIMFYQDLTFLVIVITNKMFGVSNDFHSNRFKFCKYPFLI